MPHNSSLSLYDHGFVRVAACTPRVRIADPAFNLRQTFDLAHQANDASCVLAVFPELGLSGYTNEDLFLQDALLDAVRTVFNSLVEASRALTPVLARKIHEHV